jgi:hypothetical protein
VIWNVLAAEAAPQTTLAVAVPGFVDEPVRQVHCTRPVASAVAGPRPNDWLCLPLGSVTDRLQVARGELWAIRLATDPAATGDVTETILTVPT